jgi:hypothetical protein
MMRRIFSFLLCLSALRASAQNFPVSGRLLDENKLPLPGATVAIQQVWGDPVAQTISDTSGKFIFPNIEKGGYSLNIKLLGFLEYKKQITLRTTALELGDILLKPDPNVLKTAEISAKAPLAVEKGDTTEFNAAAFKVMKDADAQDLIEKLPTVTTENGTVKAQGETVQQVLVDGKPFFGNDPSAALKNLPAEAIEKVQIFDAQSEQSQFTGFSDGNTVKTINIVTKSNMRNGQFGKAYAGYGYEDKYQLGGNINYFDGDRRLSFIGMSNNINVQNFAAEDILGAMGGSTGGGRGGAMMGGGRGGMMGGGGGRPMGAMGGNAGGLGDFLVRPSGGISTTHAAGLNYTDKWGKKTEVTGSYFFNFGHNDTESELYREFVNSEFGSENYSENTVSESDNINHRLNFRLEYKIDSSNSIMFRPRLTIQDNSSLSNTLGATVSGGQEINNSNFRLNSSLDGLNTSASLLWRHKFAKKGRTFSLDVSPGYAPKNGTYLLQSYNTFNRPIIGLRRDTLDQQTQLEASSWNIAGNAEYTEPIAKNQQLLFNYRYSFQQEESDRLLRDWLEATGKYSELNERLSNVFSNDYTTQQAGAGWTYSKKVNLSTRVNTQWATLTNYQTFPLNRDFTQTFFNVLPSASLRYNVDRSKSLRINYNSNTRLPSVDQLQNVVNNTNPLQLIVGNSNLKQSVQHNFFLNYRQSNTKKATTFFAMLGGGLTDNYIANSLTFASRDNPLLQNLDILPGAQLNQPLNLNGYYTARSFVSYGLPIKKIKCNLNLDLNYSYSRIPSRINNENNFANNQVRGVGITLASNISDKIDFTLSTRPSWTVTENSLNTAPNTEFLNLNNRLRFNWIIWEGFVLRTDLSHNHYAGLTDQYNQSFVMWNAALGKKLFKNERGEIALAINDILNQNRNIQRSVSEAYTEDVQTNALTRFVMLSFTYNLRHFNTGKQATKKPAMERPWERF